MSSSLIFGIIYIIKTLLPSFWNKYHSWSLQIKWHCEQSPATVTCICFRFQDEVLLLYCKKEKEGTVKVGPNSSIFTRGKKDFLFFNNIYPFFLFFSSSSLSPKILMTNKSHYAHCCPYHTCWRAPPEAMQMVWCSLACTVGPVYQICLPEELLLFSIANFDKNWHCNQFHALQLIW